MYEVRNRATKLPLIREAVGEGQPVHAGGVRFATEAGEGLLITFPSKAAARRSARVYDGQVAPARSLNGGW